MSKVEIEVFHDGKCPLCQREMQLLRRLDRAGAIRFVDISAEGFEPAPLGVSWKLLMERIHGRLPDGTLIEGVEVFRRLYAAVGFRRLAAFSRLPGIAQVLDVAYQLFAKNRLRLTGRCTEGSCQVHVRRAPLSSSRAGHRGLRWESWSGGMLEGSGPWGAEPSRMCAQGSSPSSTTPS